MKMMTDACINSIIQINFIDKEYHKYLTAKIG